MPFLFLRAVVGDARAIWALPRDPIGRAIEASYLAANWPRPRSSLQATAGAPRFPPRQTCTDAVQYSSGKEKPNHGAEKNVGEWWEATRGMSSVP